ncbi:MULTISPECIES: DUF4760 domain-containing protein [Lelliottia]|uniref:DUF4760 domain-containing protein n=1 Tax=Lelliottia aquatilis TaxID=2080838 RepID=A0ABX5A2Z8_9ENTR|nr:MULTISPECIES: DUF4760 domain-containing protein [Lelliottia]POZ24095.1 DUF4760 domain-containing protein [Lelliottia aquatilis]POZ27504.1 DUF4760 domain-containing protein [Lelliottia sp. 7254-16]POZ29775.1 DUF4760 domain-containing protein [Lelliottia aquatilis]POZ35340.1 DUF4760 domain-containing protein [Lelliottia aquatilis]POZ38901.1 DUF4760 domain-containing protein [Lelliottia aquatilis]
MALSPTTWQVISNVLVFGGICTAVLTIRYNVKMARKTQTATFLFESRKDNEYVESLHTLRRIRDSGKSFRSYVFPIAGSLSDAETAEGRQIQYILNFYERVAVSIKAGIYEEDMIKQASYTTVLDTYETAEPLIKALREKLRSTLTYQEFEWLHKRWKGKPPKSNK